MKKIIAASLLLLAFNAQAANFSYNNASLAYADVDIDLGVNVNGDGYDLDGNFEINKNLFIPVRYQTIDYDFGLDSTMYLFGIGAHIPLNEKMDLFGTAQLGNYELSGPGGSLDDDALALTGGVRVGLAKNLEGQAYFATIRFDNDFEDQSGFGGKLNYYFNKQLSFFGKLEFLSDIDTLSIGAQLDF